MNVDRAVVILPTVAAMCTNTNDRRLCKAMIASGPLTGDFEKFAADKAEFDGVVDFLERLAALTLPA